MVETGDRTPNQVKVGSTTASLIGSEPVYLDPKCFGEPRQTCLSGHSPIGEDARFPRVDRPASGLRSSSSTEPAPFFVGDPEVNLVSM